MSQVTKNILIIEDEKLLRDAYAIILTARGHTVYTAENGLEGLKKLGGQKPDIILLDLFMPIMDGREFLKQFRAAKHPSVKIFVLSNVSNRATEEEMLDNGANRFLLKAELSPVDLVNIVEKA